MNDSAERIDTAIDKTHLRSTRKITPHVKRKHPNVTEQQIKDVNKTRPKDSYHHEPSRYYYPVFANHHHAFQMDLLEQSKDRPPEYPTYFLILININTRYAHAIPTERKTKEAINEILSTFISTLKKQSTKSSARSSPHIQSHPSFVMMSQRSPRRLC